MSKDKITSTTISEIKVGNKNSIRISVSKRENDKKTYVDIRWFRLYRENRDGEFDEIKRPTKKGLHFDVRLLDDVIISLLKIRKEFDHE